MSGRRRTRISTTSRSPAADALWSGAQRTWHDRALRDTHFGFRTCRSTTSRALVDDVFHKVARRYDLMNDLMSGGLHRPGRTRWSRPSTRRKATGRSPCSTSPAAPATSPSASSRRAAPARRATVCDINADMLEVGRERAVERGYDDVVDFVEGNAEALPFADRQLRRLHDRLRHPQRAAHRRGARARPIAC